MAARANSRDDIDTRDLLEHLVDVAQNGAMQISVLIRFEAFSESAL